MKITIVTGAFLPVPPIMGGAVEKVWFALARKFTRRGHEVVIMSRKIPELPREEIVDGVRHLRVAGFDTPRSLLWLKALDLIYSIRTMSILPAADIIVTNTFWLPILLRDSRRGKVYVHVGRFPKGQMPKLSPKVTVIPYPAPASTTENRPPPIEQRDKTILFLGRVHREKGVHLLIEAFAKQARTVFADWKLMIVGPTEKKYGGGGEEYLAALKRVARPAGDSVIFRGPVFDSARLDREFRSARLFIYPSLAEKGESFGLAPLEAMAHGCAVVVSNLDCFHDFIRDGETGFIFEHRGPDPAAALGKKIQRAIVDQALLARIAEAGYRKSAEYSLARVADQFLADFDSVIRNSHG